jgi:hypothetical protein
MHRLVAATIAVLLSAVSSASVSVAARGQQSDVALPAVLLDLRQTLATLAAGPARTQLQDDVEWFIKEYERSRSEAITPEYVRSFARAAQLLKNRPSPQLIDDVAEDFQAKREHCRALKLGMGGVVKLRVNTRRGSTPTPDWQVLYLLKIYEWIPGAAATNFPRLSTPTELDLEPGRYWVWARDPATGRVSERVLVKAAGQRELMVDLLVP